MLDEEDGLRISIGACWESNNGGAFLKNEMMMRDFTRHSWLFQRSFEIEHRNFDFLDSFAEVKINVFDDQKKHISRYCAFLSLFTVI